jgi:NADH dehydrogenase
VKHRVVILGAGYAGVTVLRGLGNRPEVEVTLIDRHPYHFLQTEGYALISGDIPFEETVISLEALCAAYDNTTFVREIVMQINPSAKEVMLESSKVRYDTLIVALGSMTRRFVCEEDVYRYSIGAKSLRGAVTLKLFFEKELYARLESSAKARESFQIIVGGAGLSGVEIAAGMQYFFNRYYRTNALSCGLLQIHLIASKESVLYGMKPALVKQVTKRLAQLRVTLHTSARIASIRRHEALLENGESIPFDFMVFAGGTESIPVLKTLDLPKAPNGRFEVDAYLRSPDDQGIYFAGDTASLRDKKGIIQPPTAQIAIQSGALIAENILRRQQGRELRRASIRIKGLAIALGGKYAIVETRRMMLRGYIAYVVKKLTEWGYRYPLLYLARKGYRRMGKCSIE